MRLLVVQTGLQTKNDNYMKCQFLYRLNKVIGNFLCMLQISADIFDILIEKALNMNVNCRQHKTSKSFSTRLITSVTFTKSLSRNFIFTTSVSIFNKHSILTKLTDLEKQYLRENKECFCCRKINAEHLTKNCPEHEVSDVKLNESRIKQEFVSQVLASEFESSESCFSSSPIIKVETKIQDISVISIIDTAASVSLVFFI
jgi:hypothetical protein